MKNASPVSTPRLPLHLDQELSLYSTSCFALVIRPGATQRVDLVDEDDGGFVLPSQGKQVLHQSGGGRSRDY